MGGRGRFHSANSWRVESDPLSVCLSGSKHTPAHTPMHQCATPLAAQVRGHSGHWANTACPGLGPAGERVHAGVSE